MMENKTQGWSLAVYYMGNNDTEMMKVILFLDNFTW